MEEQPGPDDVVMPALLRAARGPYRDAVRTALAASGCSDLPPNGAYVVGAIARFGLPMGQIIEELGVSKQTAGQLVDTMVLRGYLVRSPDPSDRRRLSVTLTERGQAAHETVRNAIAGVDAELAGRIGAERLAQTKAGLMAIIQAFAE